MLWFSLDIAIPLTLFLKCIFHSYQRTSTNPYRPFPSVIFFPMSNRCQRCLYIASVIYQKDENDPVGRQYHHHANFNDLELSAAQGCDFCRLVRQAFIYASNLQFLQTSKEPVTIWRMPTSVHVRLIKSQVMWKLYDNSSGQKYLQGRSERFEPIRG